MGFGLLFNVLSYIKMCIMLTVVLLWFYLYSLYAEGTIEKSELEHTFSDYQIHNPS